MPVTIRKPDPLDLTEERLQIGDTTQAVTKMGNAWDELTVFSQQLNNMADDMAQAANAAIEAGKTAGKDGQSAYQVWLGQGNIGTKDDFLRQYQIQKASDGLPSSDIGLIWSEEYQCLMSWQVFKNPADNSIVFEGYASQNIGRIIPDTQPNPRPGHIKSGQIIAKADYPALQAWAIQHSLLKPVDEWSPETLFWGDDDENLQTPLLQNFIRFAGANAVFAGHQSATRIFGNEGGNHDGVTRIYGPDFWYAGETAQHFGENITSHSENKSGYDYGYAITKVGNSSDLSTFKSYETRSTNTAFLASIVAY